MDESCSNATNAVHWNTCETITLRKSSTFWEVMIKKTRSFCIENQNCRIHCKYLIPISHSNSLQTRTPMRKTKIILLKLKTKTYINGENIRETWLLLKRGRLNNLTGCGDHWWFGHFTHCWRRIPCWTDWLNIFLHFDVRSVLEQMIANWQYLQFNPLAPAIT